MHLGIFIDLDLNPNLSTENSVPKISAIALGSTLLANDIFPQARLRGKLIP